MATLWDGQARDSFHHFTTGSIKFTKSHRDKFLAADQCDRKWGEGVGFPWKQLGRVMERRELGCGDQMVVGGDLCFAGLGR